MPAGNCNLSTITTGMLDIDTQSQITIPTALVDSQSMANISTSQASQDNKRANPESAGSAISRRRLAAISSSIRKHTTSHRQVSNATSNRNSVIHRTCELDSHADTCVAGPNCVILEYTDLTASVSAFSSYHENFDDVPIVTAATAYDDPSNGCTTILILNQALYLGDKVDNTLLCPNQLRSYGIIVDDIPIHLAPPNYPATHSIHCPEQDLQIPLSLMGVFSYFDTRTPTQEELDTCKWVILTDPNVWEPHSSSFQENERIAIATSYGSHDRDTPDRMI